LARSVPEWVGKTDDSPVPARVKLRVFLAFGGRCQCGCGRRIGPGEPWECDHTVALVNGGENRESNLRPLLAQHHKTVTVADLAEKSKVARTAKKHLGLKKRSRFPGSRDSAFKKKLDGTVVRR
jgi:5-methylcytosine-specific restriction protein A